MQSNIFTTLLLLLFLPIAIFASPTNLRCKHVPYKNLMGHRSARDRKIQKGPNGFYVQGIFGRCYMLDPKSADHEMEYSELLKAYLKGVAVEGERMGRVEIREDGGQEGTSVSSYS